MEDQSPELAKCATRKEWAAMEANLKKIRGLWEQIPAIAAPVGYEISAVGHYQADFCLHMVPVGKHNKAERPYEHHYDKTRPLVGDVSFYPFNHASIHPRLQVDHESHGIWFTVNRIPTDNLPLLDHEFLEPIRVTDRFGAPAYDVGTAACKFNGECISDDLLIIRNNEAPLWKPVPLIELYDKLLDKAQFDIEGFEREAEKVRREFDEWLSPKRRKEREDMYRRDAAASWQKQRTPEEYVARSMENDRNYEGRKRKELSEAGPRPGTAWGERQGDVGRITELRARLPADNPKAYAYLCETPGHFNGYGVYAGQFTAVPRPGCRAVVRANSDYFNPKLPRTAIQLITVRAYNYCLDKVPFIAPGQCKADFKLLENMDWSALRTLMDK